MNTIMATRPDQATPGSKGRTPISFIVVSWNTRDMLLALLQRLEAIPDSETVVVDNASSDGSADAVAADAPNVTLIRNDSNAGFAAGVNLGLGAARHPLVLLVNTDAVVDAEAIDTLRAYADAHPEAGIIGPRVLNEDRTIQSSCWRFPSLLNLFLLASCLYRVFPNSGFWNRERPAARLASAGPVDAVSGCAFLVRRTLLERIGTLDESFFMYAEDTDLCLRAWQAGCEVHYTPDAEIVHACGGSSKRASSRMAIEYRRSILRFFDKHGGRARTEAARLLLLLFVVVRMPVWGMRSLIGSERRIARGKLADYLAGAGLLLQPMTRILERPTTPRTTSTA
ncbi:MAG: glycosyltransferase family 2 protein [Planctomycetota bacterium]